MGSPEDGTARALEDGHVCDEPVSQRTTLFMHDVYPASGI